MRGQLATYPARAPGSDLILGAVLGWFVIVVPTVIVGACGGAPTDAISAKTAEQVLRMVTFGADPLQASVVSTCKAQEAKLDEWQTANAEEDAQQDAQIAELRGKCDRVLEAFNHLRQAQMTAVQLLELHRQGQKTVQEVAEAIAAVDHALEQARAAMVAMGLEPPGGGRGS